VTDERVQKANKEAASYRTKLRDAEKRLEELQTQIEEATSTGQSESEKVKSQLAKLQEQLKQEKAARIEAERLRMAQSAASRYDVPEEFLPALRGETQDEIDESAKALQKVFLAAAKKLAQTIPPNPEGGDKSHLTAQANGKATVDVQQKNNREYAQKF
jgi:chromosome segregation ATPase